MRRQRVLHSFTSRTAILKSNFKQQLICCILPDLSSYFNFRPGSDLFIHKISRGEEKETGERNQHFVLSLSLSLFLKERSLNLSSPPAVRTLHEHDDSYSCLQLDSEMIVSKSNSHLFPGRLTMEVMVREAIRVPDSIAGNVIRRLAEI